MAVKRFYRKVFKKSNILLVGNLFEEVGDVLEVTLSRIGLWPMDARTQYRNKAICFSGNFKISFPDTEVWDKTVDEQDFWPKDGDILQVYNNRFLVEAQEPMSCHYCIVPAYATQMVDAETIDLAIGQTRTLDQGKAVFVYGSDFSIDGQNFTENQIVVCENNASTLTAGTSTCRVVEFKVV